MCPKNITTNWYHSPPFVVRDEDGGHPSGIFPTLLDQMISVCCGNCSLSHGVSDIIYGTPKLALNNVKDATVASDVVHMSFPIAGKKTDDEYKGEYYRPLFKSPGIAILAMSEDPSESAQAMLMSVISAWPVLVLTIIMAWLAGVVMWTLVSFYQQSYRNPQNRHSFTAFSSFVLLNHFKMKLRYFHRIHGITQKNSHVLSTKESSKDFGGLMLL